MGDHPYKTLADHCYWRRAISDVPIADVDPIVGVPFRVGRRDRIATAGSCFAQHIARYLRASGYAYFVTECAHPMMTEADLAGYNYGVFTARYGNIYTTRQLVQLLDRAYGRFQPADDAWLAADGHLVDPFRPQIQPDGFCSKREFDYDRARHFRAVRAAFEGCDIFVFTLGLTEAWRSREDGAVYPLCPGVAGGSFDRERHEFHNFSVYETITDLQVFLDILHGVNPRARVILTVSPVPLVATATPNHVLSATTYSKSVLRVACEHVAGEYGHVYYFPSYEVITAPSSRGVYFAQDCRSVTKAGVAHVMRLFMLHLTEGSDSLGPTEVPSEVDLHAARMEELVEANCDEEALDRHG